DLLADRAPAREHRGALAQPIPPQPLAGSFLRLHRLGSRLQDVELTVLSVTAPLDVHRPFVMAFDCQGVAAEFFGFGIADRESPLILLCNVDCLDRLRGAPAVA